MYYQQTPISEKPPTDGKYMIDINNCNDFAYAIYRNGIWRYPDHDMDITKYVTSWLKPITGVVMTEEQLKEMWVAAINYENDKRLGRLLNNSIDFTEYIKRFKQ